MSYQIIVGGLKEAEKAFADLAAGMHASQVARFEKTFASIVADVEARVHVRTGKLKASLVPRTHFDGEEWTSGIEFAGDPGIFELARGDKPTKDHPEGGHNFFSGVPDFYPEIQDNIDAVFRDAFNDQAPL